MLQDAMQEFSKNKLAEVHRTLGGDFDAVLMLTWSNWKTEPRSNRYHYGSRFAKLVPVLFLQPHQGETHSIFVEDSGVTGLDVVTVPGSMTPSQIQEVLDILRLRGIRKPLLWIYSAFHYGELLRALPHAFRVYHATEDYFTPSLQWSAQGEIIPAMQDLLKEVDMVVGVSEKVNRAYVNLGGFDGPVVLAENGCDAKFFELIVKSFKAPVASKVCIFQGGINARLDYDLLLTLVNRLPDWTFQFCGAAAEHLSGWQRLKERPNVQYLGCLKPEEFGRKMCAATVGIIPFLQEEMIWNSFPLKAYEYVACGLPVVSVPIAALQTKPDLFALATSADEFAAAIELAATTREDQVALAGRAAEAGKNSYDYRFAHVTSEIRRIAELGAAKPKRLNVCVLYDQSSVKVNTIREHLDAFSKYSRHHVYFMPATGGSLKGFKVDIGFVDAVLETNEGPDFSFFDVVIVHFCVRVCVEGHMPESVERALTYFRGLKVLFIQDEYDTPEVARRWMERVSIDIVYTCVPSQSIEKLYPKARFPWVKFLPTLTGYVPEDASIDGYAIPHADRPNLIGYRGRMLPAIYGELGWEKYLIGREVKRLAAEHHLTVDIEVDDSKRIYGKGWYQFLGSARSTLGTESGCNLFDFDGTAATLIRKRQEQDPSVDYWALRQELASYDNVIAMNQISPKIFEAIRTRTALVLFEGSYSGAVRPHEHYIPLKKDFSNFEEVVAVLLDVSQLRELTDRAYRDVIESGDYSYATFMHGVDRDLQRSVLRDARVRIFSYPLLALTARDQVEELSPAHAAAAFLTTSVIDRPAVREALTRYAFELSTRAAPVSRLAERMLEQESASLPDFHSLTRGVWRSLPGSMRIYLRGLVKSVAIRHHKPSTQKSGSDKFLSKVWHLIPAGAKRLARRVLYGPQ